MALRRQASRLIHSARKPGWSSRITRAGANQTAIAKGKNNTVPASMACNTRLAASGVSAEASSAPMPCFTASWNSGPPTVSITPEINTCPTRYTPPTVTRCAALWRNPRNRCAISMSCPVSRSFAATMIPPRNTGVSRYSTIGADNRQHAQPHSDQHQRHVEHYPYHRVFAEQLKGGNDPLPAAAGRNASGYS